MNDSRGFFASSRSTVALFANALALRAAPRLLPFPADRVLWYRLERDGRPRGRVAFFLARSPESGRYLASVGFATQGGSALRLWRSHDAVWLLPRGLASGAAYRAWAPAALWDQGRGRRGALERVGEHEALRTERVVGGLIVQHWFAVGVGLVQLEVVEAGEVTWRLALDEVVPRQPTLYPADTPEALWGSVGEAVRRLDLVALAALKTESLQRRTESPAAVRADDDLEAHRVRQAIGAQLALALEPRGEWRREGSVARWPVRVRQGERTVDAVVVAHHADDGWRWHDLLIIGDR